jgi:hypothetical protein
VIHGDMLLKPSFRTTFEVQSFQTADIADVVHVIIIRRFEISKRGKRVYNNTKNDVEADDIDYDLESSVVKQFEAVLFDVVQIMLWDS